MTESSAGLSLRNLRGTGSRCLIGFRREASTIAAQAKGNRIRERSYEYTIPFTFQKTLFRKAYTWSRDDDAHLAAQCFAHLFFCETFCSHVRSRQDE